MGDYYDSVRIDRIVSQVLTATNNTRQDWITAADVLEWINDCERDLAAHNAFGPKSDDLDLVADTAQYSLPTAFSDYVAGGLYRVDIKHTDGVWWPLLPWTDANRAMVYRADVASAERPHAYWTNGYYLEFTPTPSTAYSGSDAIIKVWYYYQPADHDGGASDAPHLDSSGDAVYRAYCLLRVCESEAFQGTRDNLATFYQRYESEKRRILSNLRQVTRITVR